MVLFAANRLNASVTSTSGEITAEAQGSAPQGQFNARNTAEIQINGPALPDTATLFRQVWKDRKTSTIRDTEFAGGIPVWVPVSSDAPLFDVRDLVNAVLFVPRSVVGLPLSVLSGDAFDPAPDTLQYRQGSGEIVIYINGILTPWVDAKAAANGIKMLPNAEGKPAERITGIVNLDYNGTHPETGFHWGDIVGIASHEPGLGMAIEAFRLAAQLNEAYNLLRADPTAPQHRIILIAHSEGGAISEAALDLVNARVRSEIDYYGNGPEATVSNNRGLHSAQNYVAEGDPVPYLAGLTIRIPRNLLSGNVSFTVITIPGHTGGLSFGNHNWNNTYGHLYQGH